MYKEISVKRLNVGMYVSLREIPWYKHPFLISRFLITKSSEINAIAALGRENILYDPKKSTSSPLKEDIEIEVDRKQIDYKEFSSLKAKKASELRKRRKRFHEMERHFNEALTLSQSVVAGIMNGQISFFEDAKSISANMVKAFLDDVNLSVQHINESASSDGQHFHALNVMVLSLTLGKQIGLTSEEMEVLSFGALVHDIGQTLLPKTIVIKQKLTKSELKQLRDHPRLGVSILSKLPDINREVMKIVYQHHEECNGKGYPKGLSGKGISSLAKIVSIADVYDRMINTRNPGLALSPHTALAFLFGKKKDSYDVEYLNTFIKMLGIYPPGTVCRFTSGDLGSIIGVDPGDPLHPEVILYDPSIPKHDAMIYKLGLDLDLEIKETVNPNELEQEASNYLGSRASIQYFPSTV